LIHNSRPVCFLAITLEEQEADRLLVRIARHAIRRSVHGTCVADSISAQT
jgi:hypothetical protein